MDEVIEGSRNNTVCPLGMTKEYAIYAYMFSVLYFNMFKFHYISPDI